MRFVAHDDGVRVDLLVVLSHEFGRLGYGVDVEVPLLIADVPSLEYVGVLRGCSLFGSRGRGQLFAVFVILCCLSVERYRVLTLDLLELSGQSYVAGNYAVCKIPFGFAVVIADEQITVFCGGFLSRSGEFALQNYLRAVCVFLLYVSHGYGVFVDRSVEYGFDYDVCGYRTVEVVRLSARIPTLKRVGVLRGCGFDGIRRFCDLFAIADFVRVHSDHGYAVTAVIENHDRHGRGFLSFRHGYYRFALFDGDYLAA